MSLRLLTATSAAALLIGGQAQAISVSPTTSATDLVNNIVGSGVTVVGTPTLTAVDNQVGTFNGGGAEVGFGSGIVLSSGNINDIPGPNSNTGLPETRGSGVTNGEDINTSLGTSGDPGIADSNDAAVLEFDFEFDGGLGGEVNFAFTFASEEYVNFIDTQFNDEFELLVDGVNLAVVGGDPVNINNINDLVNSDKYINNVENTDGIPNAELDISFDGLTTVLFAQSGPLGEGTHSAKFVVADVADGLLDAGVFIQAGTFNPDNPDVVIPLPAGLPLLLTGLAGLGFMSRRRQRA